MAVAALVFGIIGTVLAVLPVISMVAIPLGLIALTLGAVARRAAIRQDQPRGIPTAGLALGTVAVALGTAWLVFTLKPVLQQASRRDQAAPQKGK